MLRDLKSGRAGGKPDTTHVRTPLRVYCARACEYGNAKYERSNFLREVGDGPHPNRLDFERLREYLRACIDHASKTLDAMEMHQANDPRLENVEGMKRAAFAADNDPGNEHVGPSMLPHLCGAVASLNMALAQAVEYGLLPADPGKPWEQQSDSKKTEQIDFKFQEIPWTVGTP